VFTPVTRKARHLARKDTAPDHDNRMLSINLMVLAVHAMSGQGR
jgi:hypothetical protein